MKPTILLLHGAWHGPWCWQPLLPLLKPYQCYTPAMPGRVFKPTRAYRQITIQDYIGQLEHQILSLKGPVCVVAHSMAGLVATHLAAKYPHKISQLIYLAAYLPHSNQSLFDITANLQQTHMKHQMEIDLKANRIRLNKANLANILYNQCTTAQQQRALINLCDEPLKAFTSAVSVNPEITQMNRCYITTLEDNVIFHADQLKIASDHHIQAIYRLKADHSPFYSAAPKLSQLLKELIKD